MLLTEIWETCSTGQRQETGRLKHTRTEENVVTVYDTVGLINHVQKPKTNAIIHRNGSNKV